MDSLYGLVTLLPLPVWGSMLLFPRHRFTQHLVTAAWPFLVLAGVYGVLLIAAVATAPPAAGLTMEGFQALLASDAGFVAAWAHFAMLDLFAGVWLFRDAKYWGANPGAYLLATLFVAPLGLGAYLWRRRAWARRDPVRHLN